MKTAKSKARASQKPRTGLVESIEDPRIDGFWELFQADMDALGYTQEVEE